MSPYEALGYDAPTFLVDAADLETRFLKRTRQVHPDRVATKPDAERRAAAEKMVALNDAYKLLKDPIARARWLLESRGLSSADMPDQGFLAEMFEAREESYASPEAKARVAASAKARFEDGLRRLRDGFAAAEVAGSPAEMLAPLAVVVSELRYLARLLDELGAPPAGVAVHH